MDLGLKDKVVVVTGASKGIGLATARLLLQEGAKVAICSVTESHLREAEQELSRLGTVYAEVVDMTQEQSVYAFADHVVEKLGPIDSWVNNVGAQLTKGPDEEEYSDALLEKIYGICFKAAVFGCQAAFRSHEASRRFHRQHQLSGRPLPHHRRSHPVRPPQGRDQYAVRHHGRRVCGIWRPCQHGHARLHHDRVQHRPHHR